MWLFCWPFQVFIALLCAYKHCPELSLIRNDYSQALFKANYLLFAPKFHPQWPSLSDQLIIIPGSCFILFLSISSSSCLNILVSFANFNGLLHYFRVLSFMWIRNKRAPPGTAPCGAPLKTIILPDVFHRCKPSVFYSVTIFQFSDLTFSNTMFL